MKKILFFAWLLASLSAAAQTISSPRWADLFSYDNILCIREDNGKLITATENGLFYYNISTGEITKLSKANGLHHVKITAFDYNATTKTGIVGYGNGSMDVITPNGIFYIVDIPIAASYSGDKRINHISINGNRATISANYGVSVFNLDKREFGDSSFFFNGTSYEAAKEAVIKDNFVYAVTSSGLKKHELNNKFALYKDWTTVETGVTNIDIEGNTIAFSTAKSVFYGDGATFTPLPQIFTNIKDLVMTAGPLVVTDEPTAGRGTVSVYTGSTQSDSFDTNEPLNTAWYSSEIFAGSKLSGLITKRSEKIRPDGPYNNMSYKISLLDDQIWVATGGREAYNDPIKDYQEKNLGYYHYNGKEWIYPDHFIKNKGFNILDVAPNPAKPTEVFFTNYVFVSGQKKGVYKMSNDKITSYKTNYDDYVYRPVGIAFDEKNNLFISVCFANDNPNGTNGYYLYNPSIDDFTYIPIVNAGGAQRPLAKDGILYSPAPFGGGGGLIMKNYGNNPANTTAPFKIIRTENGLPINGTVAVALDKNDDLWIGTRTGLRVLSNPKAAIYEALPKAEPIIITQNGVGEELFRDNTILAIEVDGGNRKWVSVDGGGIFCLSPDGQQTISHFTKENSPLPNNSATDIKADLKTGKMYFVTSEGIVTYQNEVTVVDEKFKDVLVYPNPVVYANYKGNVKIKGLAEKTNIRITDAAGNLVHQAVARGGYYEWDLNYNGKRVASGIYFVLMTNADGTDKATAKIAVVN